MSSFANYKIPTSPNVLPKADKTVAKDSLLSDFTPGEKDYIVHNLYPTLKQALSHFITEARRHNQITERSESPELQQQYAINSKDDVLAATPSEHKVVVEQKKQAKSLIAQIKTPQTNATRDRKKLTMYR